MITTLIAALVVGQNNPVHCAVMQTNTANPKMAVEYAGTKVGICCGGCEGALAKEPAKYFAQAAKNKTTIGEFLFDPVNKTHVEFADAKGTSDYKGVRYYFASTANKSAFDKEPAKFTAVPKKEVMFCPISGEEIANYSTAGGYYDAHNVRFYICCVDCVKKMATDGAKYATADKAAKATTPKVIQQEG